MRVLERRTSWEGSTSEGTDSHDNTVEDDDLSETGSCCGEGTDRMPSFDAKKFILNQMDLLDIENEEANKM